MNSSPWGLAVRHFWRMIFTQKFVQAASLLTYTFPTEIIDSWQPFLKPSKRNSQTHISGVETMHEKLWPWTIYLSFFFFEEIKNNRVCHQEAASPTPSHEAGWAQGSTPLFPPHLLRHRSSAGPGPAPMTGGVIKQITWAASGPND